MSFGKELQLERVRRDITLEAIAQGTKVPARHLRALEQEEYAQLPGGVFAKGIVRSYCRHVGLDEGEWLSKFPSDTHEPDPDWAAFAENVQRNRDRSRSRMRGRWLGVLALLLVLSGVAWAAWHYVVQPRMLPLPASHTPDNASPVRS